MATLSCRPTLSLNMQGSPILKKVQRSFAVEYKSGRRKPNSNSNSIWGHVDLKSVARDVEDDAMPFAPHAQPNGAPPDDISISADVTGRPLLTPSISQHTTKAMKEETDMVDENNAMTNIDAPAVVGTLVAAKKPRKPRAKKTAPEATSTEATPDKAVATAERQKRGRKPKSLASAGTPAKSPRLKLDPKVTQAVPVASTAIDEMADLLQLEEENQRLRKLLAEKLRAENADLRKRLNLG